MKSSIVGKIENCMLLKENRQAKIEEEKISKLIIILTLFDTLISIYTAENKFVLCVEKMVLELDSCGYFIF